MSRAEAFIQEHTNITYNYNSYAQDPIPWITPDNARKAVEIAREEAIEKVKELLLSEVLPCFMHGGEADEVVAMLDEVLNQNK